MKTQQQKWDEERRIAQEKEKTATDASDKTLGDRRNAFLAKLKDELASRPGVRVLKTTVAASEWNGDVRAYFAINKDEDTVDLRFTAPRYRHYLTPGKPRVDRIIARPSWSAWGKTRQFPEPKTGFDVTKIADVVIENWHTQVAARAAENARELKSKQGNATIKAICKKLNTTPSESGLSLEHGEFEFTVHALSAAHAERFVALAIELGLAEKRS